MFVYTFKGFKHEIEVEVSDIFQSRLNGYDISYHHNYFKPFFLLEPGSKPSVLCDLDIKKQIFLRIQKSPEYKSAAENYLQVNGYQINTRNLRVLGVSQKLLDEENQNDTSEALAPQV